MKQSYEFLSHVLDSITEHIVVIDRMGNIIFVNRGWITFGQENSCSVKNEWEGVNYLKVCDDSAAKGEELAKNAADGIRKVIEQESNMFFLEYPCHSQDEKRWFMMRVTPFELNGTPYYVIVHQNVTERKLAEEEMLNLSRIDGLTGVHNRRYFDEFINNEWRRCARLNLPISLAIIDIDHFKLLNDTYGHQTGDEYLKNVGEILNTYANRPGDLCARYGGEEFVLIFGNTTIEQSVVIIDNVMNAIRDIKIPNEKPPTGHTVTASIGLAMMYPDAETSKYDLIEMADSLLYSAKANGGNQVVIK